MQGLLDNPLLAYLSGVITFVIGAALVGLHDRWNDFLSGFVSLIGWAALIEGVLLLALPRHFIGFFAKLKLSEGMLRYCGLFTFIAGFSLLTALFI